jgi:aldehyde dehydrogenase (NAD+)
LSTRQREIIQLRFVIRWHDGNRRMTDVMDIAEIFERMDYGPAPESPSIVGRWLDARDRTFKLFIDGAWSSPLEGVYFESVNPATGEVIARCAQAGAQDVEHAVRAARRALEPWHTLGGYGRARLLYALARHVQKQARFLAVLETIDNGKPIREARDIDIPLVARHFYYYAGWAQLTHSEFTGYEPAGVAGQIIPWNFPLLMLAWKVAPALAAGCTVVLKPAEQTPLTALAFAELCQNVGIPPGVVNILTGDGRTGECLVDHPGIDKIAFTGSTEVGRAIRRRTAGSGKMLSLELGGKSPALVFDDADLDSAVEGIVDGIWFNQGQVCCAGSRLLVHERVAETMLDKLKARMLRLTIGDPLDKGTDIGAIITSEQLRRIEMLVDQGRREGAKCWQPEWQLPANGYYFAPTLLTDVAPTSAVAQQEIFGPVLAVMSFRTPAEAVELANNTRYGLAASIWSETINLALDVAPKLKCGTVWVNCTNLFDASCGFGGYRESGFGREGGREGMYEYLRPTRSGQRAAPPVADGSPSPSAPTLIDRTAKLYIGGRQLRPDSGYSLPVRTGGGKLLAEVPSGNRKDIRNAVEAAHHAASWGALSSHARAQVLFYVAENLAARRGEFAERVAALTGGGKAAAEQEIDAAIERTFFYAAWADKFEGVVHAPPLRGLALAMVEAIGVVGIICPDEAPLLALVSLVCPAIAVGNAVVVVPSERYPLPAIDFYQVLDTSDVPAGVVNIVTGPREELSKTLAAHADVDALWYFADDADGATAAELASTSNLKQVWTARERRVWQEGSEGQGREFLRHATQVKNIWIPYGE